MNNSRSSLHPAHVMRGAAGCRYCARAGAHQRVQSFLFLLLPRSGSRGPSLADQVKAVMERLPVRS